MSDTTFDLGGLYQVPLIVVETDSAGTPVNGPKPVLTSSDETVVTLQEQADGTTVAVRATNNSGTVTITATVTNPDGTYASGNLVLSLATVDVTNVEITAGTPS